LRGVNKIEYPSFESLFKREDRDIGPVGGDTTVLCPNRIEEKYNKTQRKRTLNAPEQEEFGGETDQEWQSDSCLHG
jgi:hypothetical protein